MAGRTGANGAGAPVSHDGLSTFNPLKKERSRCMDSSEKTIWGNQIRRIQGIVGYFNPYDLLAPLRPCSGSIFLSKIHSESDLELHLPTLLQILLDDFSKRIGSVNEDSPGVEPIEMNDVLLNYISGM